MTSRDVKVIPEIRSIHLGFAVTSEPAKGPRRTAIVIRTDVMFCNSMAAFIKKNSKIESNVQQDKSTHLF
jgi:hypothetical protein